MRLIDLHKEWCEKGETDFAGLCKSVPKKYLKELTMFLPTEEDKMELAKDFYSLLFWACGKKFPDLQQRLYEYTPLRQTIVLLICAMKKELK